MPKADLKFEVQQNPTAFLKICEEAALQAELAIKEVAAQTRRLVVVKPKTSFHWAVTVTISVAEGPSNSSSVTLSGKIAGFGPIQRRHLHGVLAELQQSIEVVAKKAAPPATPGMRIRCRQCRNVGDSSQINCVNCGARL